MATSEAISGEQCCKIKIASVLWGLWFSRNLKVWENKMVTPQITMDWSVKHITEWQTARKTKLSRLQTNTQSAVQGSTKWVAPVEGKLKVNVDASVVAGTPSFVVGMVLRNHHGMFVQARNARCAGEVPALGAEAWGVLEALKWIQILQVPNVEIKCDSLLTVTTLRKKLVYCLEVGFILDECIAILQSRPDIFDLFCQKACQ